MILTSYTFGIDCFSCDLYVNSVKGTQGYLESPASVSNLRQHNENKVRVLKPLLPAGHLTPLST